MLNIHMFLIYGKMLLVCAYCILFSTFIRHSVGFFPIFFSFLSIQNVHFPNFLLTFPVFLHVPFHSPLIFMTFIHVYSIIFPYLLIYSNPHVIFPLHFPFINARIPFRIYGLCRKGYGYEFIERQQSCSYFSEQNW